MDFRRASTDTSTSSLGSHQWTCRPRGNACYLRSPRTSKPSEATGALICQHPGFPVLFPSVPESLSHLSQSCPQHHPPGEQRPYLSLPKSQWMTPG